MGTSMRQHIAGSVVLLSFSAACLAVEFGSDASLSSSSGTKCSDSFESSVRAGPGITSGQDKASVGKPCGAPKQLETKNQPVDHRIMPLILFLHALRGPK